MPLFIVRDLLAVLIPNVIFDIIVFGCFCLFLSVALGLLGMGEVGYKYEFNRKG